ncbi:ribonuclease Oy [Orussus abietinus]|uniref:ribonuclease Oy n=1 Tax=Orussus abietinus TaxID=222816 RepID=UPI000626AABD|nr:ribonuclease Oy [Orussus abietinus]
MSRPEFNAVIIFLGFALIGATYELPTSDTDLLESGSTDFDILIFTQHWPQTVCFQWKEGDANHSCSLPQGEEWSIHGIWPTQLHKLGPQFCNKSLHFNASALLSIESELNKKWLDVEIGTKPHSFWKHEWDKHGTCAAVLESLNTELKYFQKGLDFLDLYDMKNTLAKASIMPGMVHSVQDILDGVKRILGKNSQVECIKNPKTLESYLFEIRICFNKSLELIDCDGIHGYPSNCDQNEQVNYPGSVPEAYHVIQL